MPSGIICHPCGASLPQCYFWAVLGRLSAPKIEGHKWALDYDALFVERVDPIWERWGKPVFFYTINTQAISNDPLVTPEEAQATELEGIFQALASRPWIAGSMSWAYHMTDAPLGGADGVRNRLAEAVLAKYYGAYTGNR